MRELSWRRARGLAWRADGRAGWRARRAWRILTEAAARGDHYARTEVWEAWLRGPAEETWSLVSGWRSPAHVLAAAVDPARTPEARAAIGAYCTGAGLTPEDPVRRALFFVLTGDAVRYEAADPDGTLLRRGYQLAGEQTRNALRQAMLGTGNLDLVRVVAAGPDQPVTAGEADHLGRQLAAAGEWTRLWQLMRDMPLASAVAAAKHVGEWRPDDEAGREYLARLAAADPDVLTAAVRAKVTRFATGSVVLELSFAPDGTELAVHDLRGTKVHAVPGGRVLADYSGRSQSGVLALGDGTIVHQATRGRFPVIRRRPGRPAETVLHDMVTAGLGRTPDGFVVGGDVRAYFGAAAGPWLRVADLAELSDADSAVFGFVDADPLSGNLAFRVGDETGNRLVLTDAGLRVLARAGCIPVHGAFCGPDRLVVRPLRDRAVETWRREGDRLVRSARVEYTGHATPVPVAAHNRLVIPGDFPLAGSTWLDADTLAEVGPPPGFPAVDAARVAVSADGMVAAVSTGSGVLVHDLGLLQLPDLPGWSLSDAVLADLATVAALEKRQLDPLVAEAVAVLRAGLAFRFGTEVALGDGRWVPDDDDVALGGPR